MQTFDLNLDFGQKKLAFSFPISLELFLEEAVPFPITKIVKLDVTFVGVINQS